MVQEVGGSNPLSHPIISIPYEELAAFHETQECLFVPMSYHAQNTVELMRLGEVDREIFVSAIFGPLFSGELLLRNCNNCGTNA